MAIAKKPKTPEQGTAEVDAFMDKLDHPFKAEVQAVREIIKGVNEGITEQVKWNAPTFSYKGYMVTFNLHAQKHVHLVFHNGAVLENKHGLLEGNYPDRRMAYFNDMEDVLAKQAALEEAVQGWVADGQMMQSVGQVVSKDGTPIAYERTGNGPPVILVDGALCYRASGPARPMAAQLAPHFTVYAYDRRGRGESGDTAHYAVEREVEDIAALIAEAGGSAYVFGVSSGAALALAAANAGLAIPRLALYEPPFIVDGTRDPLGPEYLASLKAHVAAGRRSDAVKVFMRSVGVPGFFLMIFPLMPVWSKLKAVAHTLPYDITLMGETQYGKPLPRDAWPNITMPTLVADGGKSPTWMRNGVRSLADLLPNGEYRTLQGQNHMVKAAVLAPVLTEFFNG